MSHLTGIMKSRAWNSTAFSDYASSCATSRYYFCFINGKSYSCEVQQIKIKAFESFISLKGEILQE